jgi:hypothetical protein
LQSTLESDNPRHRDDPKTGMRLQKVPEPFWNCLVYDLRNSREFEFEAVCQSDEHSKKEISPADLMRKNLKSTPEVEEKPDRNSHQKYPDMMDRKQDWESKDVMELSKPLWHHYLKYQGKMEVWSHYLKYLGRMEVWSHESERKVAMKKVWVQDWELKDVMELKKAVWVQDWELKGVVERRKEFWNREWE